MKVLSAVLPLLVVGATFALLLRRGATGPREAARRVGFALGMFLAGFMALFVAGETLDDPGGWAAVGLVAAWAVPMVGLSVLAWRWPDRARPFVLAAAGLVAVVAVWSALDPDGWRSFEDDHGPVQAILTFSLLAPLVVLGRRRTRLAGLALLAVGAVPWAVAVLAGQTHGFGSLAAASIPPILIGVLYVLAGDVPAPADEAPGGPACADPPRRETIS